MKTRAHIIQETISGFYLSHDETPPEEHPDLQRKKMVKSQTAPTESWSFPDPWDYFDPLGLYNQIGT